MSEQLNQLQQLQAELHAVNQDLAQAARPLERLSEMNEQQRQQAAQELRSRLARWEFVTQQISQLLRVNSATSEAGGQMTKANSRE